MMIMVMMMMKGLVSLVSLQTLHIFSLPLLHHFLWSVLFAAIIAAIRKEEITFVSNILSNLIREYRVTERSNSSQVLRQTEYHSVYFCYINPLATLLGDLAKKKKGVESHCYTIFSDLTKLNFN